VAAVSGEVRRRMREAIDGMLARRHSIWHGCVFEEDAAPAPRRVDSMSGL
jgi:hypothetical protein